MYGSQTKYFGTGVNGSTLYAESYGPTWSCTSLAYRPRAYTQQIKSSFVRTGTNNNIQVRTLVKKKYSAVATKLVKYRDKQQPKVIETKTVMRRIRKTVKVVLRNLDDLESIRSDLDPKRYQQLFERLKPRYRLYPKSVGTTKLKVRRPKEVKPLVTTVTRYRCIFIEKKRKVHPLVTRFQYKRIPKLKQCIVTDGFRPNSLTTTRFEVLGADLDLKQQFAYKPGCSNPRWVAGWMGNAVLSVYNGQALGSSYYLIQNQVFDLDVASFNSYWPSLESACLGKVYSRLRDSDINVAVAIAEGGQTLNLIRELWLKLVAVVASGVKLSPAGVYKALFGTGVKGIANTHLAIQYGIRPLMADIEGALKEISKFPKLSFDVKASKTLKLPIQNHSWPEFTQGPRFVDNRQKVITLTAVMKVRCTVDNPFLRHLSVLGLTNVHAVVWEKIPFSFVIDWLIPIGKALENMNALDAVSVDWWHTTRHIQSVSMCTRTFGGTDQDGYVWPVAKCSHVSVNTSTTRTIGSGSFPLQPYPRFKNPFSPIHIANAIALLTSLRRIT